MSWGRDSDARTEEASAAGDVVPGMSLRALTKRYGDLAAVESLSLEVKPGELLALLGPSGCGKTTTLRLVAGFVKPEAGEIWVGERCLSSPAAVIPPERRRMAMIFQSYALWPHMTVAQNVAYGLRFKRGLTRDERHQRVREIVRVVQLAGFEARYPGELSGGQQQRVAVARALVIEPEILLLDEPLSNLDANLREEMRFEIRRWHETFGITTLYVTHDQAEAMVISDRIAVLERGRVVQVGTADELFHHPRTRFVAEFIGKTNLVEGTAVASDTVEGRAWRLRVAPVGLEPGRRVAVSIRPHQIALAATSQTPAAVVNLAGLGERMAGSSDSDADADRRRPGPGEGAGASAERVGGSPVNELLGTILRASFLGDGVDYQVQVADSDLVLRVTAPASPRLRPGEAVVLRIDAAACVPVAASDRDVSPAS
jgi:iron(III) transport system ATP-binding protein